MYEIIKQDEFVRINDFFFSYHGNGNVRKFNTNKSRFTKRIFLQWLEK